MTHQQEKLEAKCGVTARLADKGTLLSGPAFISSVTSDKLLTYLTAVIRQLCN